MNELLFFVLGLIIGLLVGVTSLCLYIINKGNIKSMTIKDDKNQNKTSKL